jgi:4-amino-4-deoxy-L-arabinose transferase-like glycosyltransferase
MFRLNREMVDVWDESYFATTALELLDHGRWAVTTFHGEVDYFNSKPPLNVWLIALSFKLFGVGLLPMRLPAALSAWFTILVVQRWSRLVLGTRVALLATVVLAATYGFLYVHSGRTANADAPMTLMVTLVAYAAWRTAGRPILVLWLGPLSAAIVLLKGPAALMYVMPLVAIVAFRIGRARPLRVWPCIVTAILFLVPIVGWGYARWRFDQWRFLSKLIFYDTVFRSHSPVDDHAGPPWFYLDVLQRYQYEWVIVGIAAAIVATLSRRRMREWHRQLGDSRFTAVMVGWLAATLAVPSIVATKLTWYLNPFYPLFAMVVATLISLAWSTAVIRGRLVRARVVIGLAVLAVFLAEGKLAWRSYTQLDLGRSAQGLLLTHADAIRGRRVFASVCPVPEAFLAKAASSECLPAPDVDAFLRESTSQDLWIGGPDERTPSLVRIGANRGASLHRRPRRRRAAAPSARVS